MARVCIGDDSEPEQERHRVKKTTMMNELELERLWAEFQSWAECFLLFGPMRDLGPKLVIHLSLIVERHRLTSHCSLLCGEQESLHQKSFAQNETTH